MEKNITLTVRSKTIIKQCPLHWSSNTVDYITATFDLDEEATAIEKAVEAVLDKNYRTGDIMSAGCTQVGCSQMGDLLTAEI